MSKDFKKLRIVFMGTPAFAVASLEALVLAGCNIVGVITAPDKPAGRGMELQQSAVKVFALQNELTILQPEKLKDPSFLESLKNLQADLQIVVAFRMLPEVVWNMPAMGTINVHGSLLPKYRGAAPINHAIINGETETGVTTFLLKQAIDTGAILMQDSIPITLMDTAGTLHDKMMQTGAELLLKTIENYSNGNLVAVPQSESKASTHAPKIFTEDCIIHWDRPATEVYNFIRGLSPNPSAFTVLNDKKLKIFSSNIVDGTCDKSPGTSITDGKSFLKFACKDAFLQIEELQLAGKKKMPVTDFLRGFRS